MSDKGTSPDTKELTSSPADANFVFGVGSSAQMFCFVFSSAPTARDWKSSKGKTQTERWRSAGPSLAEVSGGSLNPTWVEWLMGFPVGWTDLEDSATQSCHKSPSGSDGKSLERCNEITNHHSDRYC